MSYVLSPHQTIISSTIPQNDLKHGQNRKAMQQLLPDSNAISRLFAQYIRNFVLFRR